MLSRRTANTRGKKKKLTVLESENCLYLQKEMGSANYPSPVSPN
jgi:hypothetical protein